MGVFLAEKDLKGLKKYKYSSVDQSLVSKYVLKPFYARFVTLFPEWVAPNLITLGGLAFTGFGVLCVLYYNPFLTDEMPRWVYASFAIEMFLYQTFDACDGLQARRTQQSSPLGELFDHTVDAINTSLGMILVAATLRVDAITCLFALFLASLNFYLSTWEEFHTGTLFLSVFSGPVEGVLMLVGIFLASAVFGTDIWKADLVAGYSFCDLWVPFSCVALVFNVVSSFGNVMKTKVPLNQAMYEISPFALLWASIFVWLNCVPFLVQTHLIPIIFVIGLAVAFMVGRIITAHVTHNPVFPMWNPLMLIPSFCVVCHCVGTWLPHWDPVMVDITCLWISLGLSVGLYASFVAEIIYEITGYLDIGCLYIKYPKKKQTRKKAD